MVYTVKTVVLRPTLDLSDAEQIVENYKKSGWVVKNKGERESNYGTIRYILSHAGVKKGYHTLTWFGDLSYSKLIMPKYENELNLCIIK